MGRHQNNNEDLTVEPSPYSIANDPGCFKEVEEELLLNLVFAEHVELVHDAETTQRSEEPATLGLDVSI